MRRLLPVLIMLASMGTGLPAFGGAPPEMGRPGMKAARYWVRDLQAAQAALSAQDHARAYALYLRQARRNPLAQFMVGQFHQQGWGGRAKDPVTACRWFGKAASHRIPTAEHLWGNCLAQGIGQPVDVPAALRWYEQAAADGHLLSLCTAGEFHVQGQGVTQDVPRGIAMCSRAAQAHVPAAMWRLATLFDQGTHVRQDLAAARYWYEQAAQHRVVEAQYRLGLMLAQGEGGEPDLGAALGWLEMAASAGHAPAYLPTAMLYGNAPVQADTGALAPEHLAKVYLWTMAAKARGTDAAQIEQARRLEEQVMAVMPATWRPALDLQVTAHLSRTDATR